MPPRPGYSTIYVGKSNILFIIIIFSPVPNLKSGLAYSEDGQTIDSGCLDELIHEFVPRAHYVPPEDYQFTFLLASRLFLTPNRLLSGMFNFFTKSVFFTKNTFCILLIITFDSFEIQNIAAAILNSQIA